MQNRVVKDYSRWTGQWSGVSLLWWHRLAIEDWVWSTWTCPYVTVTSQWRH